MFRIIFLSEVDQHSGPHCVEACHRWSTISAYHQDRSLRCIWPLPPSQPRRRRCFGVIPGHVSSPWRPARWRSCGKRIAHGRCGRCYILVMNIWQTLCLCAVLCLQSCCFDSFCMFFVICVLLMYFFPSFFAADFVWLGTGGGPFWGGRFVSGKQFLWCSTWGSSDDVNSVVPNKLRWIFSACIL